MSLSENVVELLQEVTAGRVRAVAPLAAALRAATPEEREEFVNGGAGESLHMAWTAKGLGISLLAPVEEALRG